MEGDALDTVFVGNHAIETEGEQAEEEKQEQKIAGASLPALVAHLLECPAIARECSFAYHAAVRRLSE